MPSTINDKNTKHHILPRSRLTTRQKELLNGRNIKKLPNEIHSSWHTMFYNMLPFEIVVCIGKMITPRNYFSKFTVISEFDNEISKYVLNNLSNPRLKMVLHYRQRIQHIEHWNLVFNNADYLYCLSQIINDWSIDGYFKKVEAEISKTGQRFIYENTGIIKLIAA